LRDDRSAQPQWTSPVAQPQLSGTCHTEFVICDQSIEEAFRDLKSLFNFQKLMNKRRSLMEKMVALLLIAYALALILGEALREQLFPPESRKHKLYSGPFIFLKLQPDLSPPILALSCSAFSQMVCPVRTRVRI
jgi:hypothetical protein